MLIIVVLDAYWLGSATLSHTPAIPACIRATSISCILCMSHLPGRFATLTVPSLRRCIWHKPRSPWSTMTLDVSSGSNSMAAHFIAGNFRHQYEQSDVCHVCVYVCMGVCMTVLFIAGNWFQTPVWAIWCVSCVCMYGFVHGGEFHCWEHQYEQSEVCVSLCASMTKHFISQRAV